GHGDHLYAVAISPDGQTLATGSYDQKILIWNLKTGTRVRELTGHNGPVFDLAFHPKGEILASASGDRTVKLWNVKTGDRLETFTEPEKDQYTVAFRGDGKVLVAGGVDNRIRVWNISRTGKAGTNPLQYTRFAHEAPILRLMFSPDNRRLISSSEDQTIKLWETKSFTQQKTLKNQSDWAVALAVTTDNSRMFIGRLDGTLTQVSLDTKSSGGIAATPIRDEPLNPPGDASHAVAQMPETEPNNSPKQATVMTAPGSAAGVLSPEPGQSQDADFYRFSAKKGETWIIETNAARSKSPADTAIDVLHPDGTPVERLLLRAVRDSYITFRPIDSTQDQVRVKNWEEMQLNQFLYMGGEVTKLFRMPQGPDSGFQFYKSRGKRRLYFDSSATIHALGDPVYIVEPYVAGSELIDNGLPVFPVYFSNDDDAERKLGTDSLLTFT
ncbi:MAG: WD40 repeat domain-containing protein, partial [Planctomycetaceae bacterium]|nr:WD40 repeat domain-containing protein [Planctomycetaceae bacterium]